VNGISKRLYFRFDGHAEALTNQFDQAWSIFRGVAYRSAAGLCLSLGKTKGRGMPLVSTG
jgi:hypothetical protein